MTGFRLVKQEGSDGSGGVGGWVKPPKVGIEKEAKEVVVEAVVEKEEGANVKEDQKSRIRRGRSEPIELRVSKRRSKNPFSQAIWPCDMPEEKELLLLFARRKYVPRRGLLAATDKNAAPRDRVKFRQFGRRADDQISFDAVSSFEEKLSRWEDLYDSGEKSFYRKSKTTTRDKDGREGTPGGGGNVVSRNKKYSIRDCKKRKRPCKSKYQHRGIALMDPSWDKVLGAIVELPWSSTLCVAKFEGWRKCRVEAVRWQRTNGGCPLLDVLLFGPRV